MAPSVSRHGTRARARSKSPISVSRVRRCGRCGASGGAFQLKFEINPPINCLKGGTPPAWNSSAEPDLILWSQTEARSLAAKCGIRPDSLILGSSAAALFMANKSVAAERALLANLQNTAPTFEDAAVTFIG